jgi:hypothetical protein
VADAQLTASTFEEEVQMPCQFEGFADFHLPALAKMLELELDEYVPVFEHLRDRLQPSRTPGDLYMIAESIDTLLAKWSGLKSPQDHSILGGVRQHIDELCRICTQEEPTPFSGNSFVFMVGAACNELIVALDDLIALIHSGV